MAIIWGLFDAGDEFARRAVWTYGNERDALGTPGQAVAKGYEINQQTANPGREGTGYESSVTGGIALDRPLRGSYAPGQPQALSGIAPRGVGNYEGEAGYGSLLAGTTAPAAGVSPIAARVGTLPTQQIGQGQPSIADWRNYTIPQLKSLFTPQELSQLPVEALSQFSNPDLQTVIDANPAILGDIPADRLVKFEAEALNLFVKNLEARGDYNSNSKVQAQAQNLRGALQRGGLTEPAARVNQPPVGALPGVTTPISTPPPSAGGAASGVLPGAAPIPASSVAAEPYGTENYYGMGYDLPRLGMPGSDYGGLQGITPGSPLGVYLGLAGVQAPGPARLGGPSEQRESFSRLASFEADDGGGKATEPKLPPLPPGFIWIPDPATGSYKPVHDPSYHAPATPRVGLTPGEAQSGQLAREKFKYDQQQDATQAAYRQQQLVLTAEQHAAEQALREAQFQWQQARDARDFEAEQAWRQRTAEAQAKLQEVQAKRGEQEFGLQAELGYAGSRRQDLLANLQRAGVTGYYGGQPTLEREQAIGASERANLASRINLATQAAQIALRQGDQAEAQRQFNIVQDLRDRQFGLESELGRGRAALERAQFQFQVQRDPSSAIQKAFALRGQVAPEEAAMLPPVTPQRIGGSVGGYTPLANVQPRIGDYDRGVQTAEEAAVSRGPYSATPLDSPRRSLQPLGFQQIGTPELATRRVGPSVGGYSPIGSVGPPGALETTRTPLSSQEILSSPYTAPGLQNVFGGRAPASPQLPLAAISGQRFSQLLPSEQRELGATVQAAGVAPEDYFEQSRRLTQVAAPPGATRRIAAPGARTRLY